MIAINPKYVTRPGFYFQFTFENGDTSCWNGPYKHEKGAKFAAKKYNKPYMKVIDTKIGEVAVPVECSV